MSECIEFQRMSTAREMRGEHADHICPIDDDARTKEVCFTSDTPETVLERARDIATTERAEAGEEALDPVPLDRSEKRDLDFSRDGVNVFKARYLKGLGERYNVDPFQHVDLAEIDGVRDAEGILDRARKSGGSGRGGGTAQFDDEAAERERRERRAGAEQARAEECDHAEDFCANGDQEACEFLREACDTDPEDLRDMEPLEPDMSGDRDGPTEEESGDIFDRLDGPEKGAYARSWGGYQAATEAMQDAAETMLAAIDNAHDAARAINGIRAGEGAGPIHFEKLEKGNAALLDLARHAARTCHECHAQHGGEPDGLDHEVAATDREDIRRFVTAGGRETSVGNPDGIGPATNEPENPPEWAAQSDVTDFGGEDAGTPDATPGGEGTETPMPVFTDSRVNYPPSAELPGFRRIEGQDTGETVEVVDRVNGGTFAADVDLEYKHDGGERYVAGMRGAPDAAPPGNSMAVATWSDPPGEWVLEATAEPEAVGRVVAQIAARVRQTAGDSAPQLAGMEAATDQPPIPRDLDPAGDPDVLEREQQRTLGGGRTDPQATFAAMPDEPDGEAEIEQEAASEFGVDDRSDPSRGAADATETEEQTLGESTGGFDAREGGQGGFDDFEEEDT